MAPSKTKAKSTPKAQTSFPGFETERVAPSPVPGHFTNGSQPTPVDAAAPPRDIGERLVHQNKQAARWRSTAGDETNAHHAHRNAPVPTYGAEDFPHPGIPTKSKSQSAEMEGISDSLIGIGGKPPLNAAKLYRSYKHSPHLPASVFLKYLVHRYNHVADYDYPGNSHYLDSDFLNLVQKGKASDKNGHVSIRDLHDWTDRHATTLMPQLLGMRDKVQSQIQRGIGLNTRSINGEPYIALTRGLHSEMMSNEHPLSSHADKPHTGFGNVMHHSWVPLKSLWFSYDLGPKLSSGNMGPEDEFLVSNTGTRYQATPEDVKSSRVKASGEGVEPLYDSDPDEKVAEAVRTRGGARGDDWGGIREILEHPNAGPKVYEAAQQVMATRKVAGYRDSLVGILHHKWVPREAAMQHMAVQGPKPYALKNPNLTSQDLETLAPQVLNPSGWPWPGEDVISTWLKHPNMNSHVLERAWQLPRFHRAARPQGLARNYVMTSSLATPAMLQAGVDELTSPSIAGLGIDTPVAGLTLVVNNPHHTEEQARTIYNWATSPAVSSAVSVVAAELVGKSKLPVDVVRELVQKEATLETPGAKLGAMSSEDVAAGERASTTLSWFTVNNPHAAPILAQLAAEGKVRFGRLVDRLENFDRLEPELQGPFIRLADAEYQPNWLTDLAGRKGLTQETVNTLAHYPDVKVRENLFLNKSVSPEQIREAYPKEFLFPEVDPQTPLPWTESLVADEIASAYHRRKNFEAKMAAEHFIKPLPQNLAKSEDDMWQATARDWLAQQRVKGFFYTTDREHAENILRDEAIEPQFTDEILDGEAVIAHRASPTFLDSWRVAASPDEVAVYFETQAESQEQGDLVYWTNRVPIENAHIADVAEAPLTKFQTPLTFPQLGVSDDRRETKLATTPLERKTVLRAASAMESRENMIAPGAYERLAENPAAREAAIDKAYKGHLKDPAMGATFEGLAGVGHPGHGVPRADRQLIPGAGTGQSAISAVLAPSSYTKAKKWGPNQTLLWNEPGAMPATAVHEDLHRIFGRVQHLHGEAGRDMLAHNLMEAMPKDLRGAVEQHLFYQRPELAGTPEFYEEALTELGTYLNSPENRKQFHARKQHSPEQAHAFHTKMGRAYKLLHAISATANEGWLRRLRPWLKKGEASIPFSEAQGFAGLSAADAYEIFKGSNKLLRAQPELLDPNAFAFEFEGNPALYVAVAERADELELRKMAFRDVPIGNPARAYRGQSTFDYSHVLTPEHRQAGYSLRVRVHPDSTMVAQAMRRGQRVGSVAAGPVSPDSQTLTILGSEVWKPHRGAGLGRAMYEAVLAHAKNAGGYTQVAGSRHSTSAHGVHRSLKAKHGTDYISPSYSSAPSSDYDAHYGSYKYALKSEDFNISMPDEKVFKPGEESAARMFLGHNSAHEKALEAARFLTGRKEEVDEDVFRMALGVYDGDYERAALIAVGLTDSKKNLKALRAALSLGEFSHSLSKAETAPGTPHIESVEAGAPDAQETAEEIQRAVTAGLIQPLKLGGKHSKGAMAARDPKTGSTWLLKPAVGKPSPARGIREDPSSQSAREAAFWHCSKVMGLENYLPRCDLLLVNGAEVAAMKLLGIQWKSLDEFDRKVAGYAREVLGPYLARGDVHRFAFMDWTLGQADRHGSNIMVHADSIALIDEGSTFAASGYDPARDSKSFVPYYLRVFTSSGFKKRAPKDRVGELPTLTPQVDSDFRKWALALDPARLVEVMTAHGIGEAAQKAVIERLYDLQHFEGSSLSGYVNSLWAGTVLPLPLR